MEGSRTTKGGSTQSRNVGLLVNALAPFVKELMGDTGGLLVQGLQTISYFDRLLAVVEQRLSRFNAALKSCLHENRQKMLKFLNWRSAFSPPAQRVVRMFSPRLIAELRTSIRQLEEHRMVVERFRTQLTNTLSRVEGVEQLLIFYLFIA